ncbi:carboxypeptidase-like regulatory domain-containing protein [Brackiella oedipodis]|uniref:carboxypeptidase-like regulatory domain-containing protein n=1 Tax=Brackiella oedipodis TaxID=124225 RepID=UPI000570EAF0|nr:carboxypeptidase-like regulatory domain-containing protein [Brackiella oedipodis]
MDLQSLNVKLLQRVGSLGLILALAACASSPAKNPVKHKVRKEVPRVAFDASQIKAGSEKTMLVGLAYILEGTTHVRHASNIDVVLNPVTESSTQWFNEVCHKGRVLEGEGEAAYRQHIYTTKTNEYGQYVFLDVPVGEYYLTSRMYWFDTKPMSGPVQYGGLVAKKLKLESGPNTINITSDDRCPMYYH